MRRPFAENEESRLDTLLRKRAEMGVKVGYPQHLL
jgi:hypothetical protein